MKFRLRPSWNITWRSVLMSLAFASILAVSVAGVWVLANAVSPQRVSPPADPIGLSMHISGSDWDITYETDASVNNTPFSLLLEAADMLDFEVVWRYWTVPLDSAFVDSINGDDNGNGGRWWQYWVNGEYGSVGADRAALSDGDMVEWRFAQYPP